MPVILAITGALCCAFAQGLIFFYAPVESSLGITQKIFYLHLPLAWWALFSFFLLFLTSAAYIFAKKIYLDSLSAAAAEIGLLFAVLSLITGVIWGKKSWGVWWTWDPRLATTLIMCFIYGAYLIFRGLDMPPARSRLVSAVIGVIAFLDVPLVFFSARIFRSIHPAVFTGQGGGLEPEMKTTIIICIISLGFIWLALFLFRARQLESARRLARLLFYEGSREG